MRLSQHPQTSVRQWRITFHCGYEIESRIDPQMFHCQTPICCSHEMNKVNSEAKQMAHQKLNTPLVSFNKSTGAYNKGM
jgi:hypothetical protein